MKGTRYLLQVFCLVLALVASAGAVARAADNAWSRSGLDALTVYALAVDPVTTTTLFAGTGAGVYRSTNGGADWDLVSNPLTFTSNDVRCLAIDPVNPDVVYAGTYGGGVYKTINGGDAWVAANNTGLTNLMILSLAFDPANDILYAGTYGGGVFKTANGGTSWTNPLSILSIVTTVAIDPLAPATLYAGTAGGVYKSTNGGTTWETANNGLTALSVNVMVIQPGTPATLYAGTAGSGAFKSTTAAASWYSADLDTMTVNALTVDPGVTSLVFAGTAGSGVYRSTTGGASWGSLSTGLIAGNVYALAIDPADPDTLYAGTNSGVFKISLTAVPSPADDGDSCFIATAAYGSPMEPRVKILRQFRDRYLMTSGIGRAFVNLYYRVSPPMAQYIASREDLRTLVGWALLPLVGLGYAALHPWPALTLSALLLAGETGLVRLRRRRAPGKGAF